MLGRPPVGCEWAALLDDFGWAMSFQRLMPGLWSETQRTTLDSESGSSMVSEVQTAQTARAHRPIVSRPRGKDEDSPPVL